MASYQRVVFMGYLGGDPEMRTFNDGAAVTSFRIAASEKWKDRNSGETKERTTWLRCQAFGRTAEIADQFLKKGAPVLVEGKLQNDEWTDKNSGEKRTGMSLRVDHLTLMGDGGGGGQRDRPDRNTPATETEPFTDDIPF